MKKLFLVAILVLGLASCAYAEISATAYSQPIKSDELQTFIYAYNNSGAAISSNYVVVLDTTWTNIASGRNLDVGTRITTTTTSADPLALGITDETIANGSIGKICVGGPHKAYVLGTAGTLAAGASLATTTTAGALSLNATTTGGYPVATLLSAVQTQDNSTRGTGGARTIDVSADYEPTSLYWVYVKGAIR